ncbi:hypothetical protein MKX03_022281 [Papaver bracteatum]|nr:hypothetical protein MKX03_022281 [Papaver bracteatum]
MLFTSCFCYFIAVIHNWMTYVAFDQAINQKILSNSTYHKAEIKIADAQYSHVDGVIVLITGCLTGKDNVGRKFTQLFFLAPQEKGYYVQNDVFRYLVEDQVLKPETVLPVVPDTIAPTVEELSNCVEVHEYLNNKVEVVVQEEIVEEPPQFPEPSVPVVQEYAPKKSYTSILRNQIPGPSPVNVPTTTIKVKSATIGKKAPTPAAPTPAHGASAPNSNNASANNNVVEEVAGHSIYIKNLPTTATDEHVEKEFKIFGPIKPGGVQVRSNKLSSMQNAVKV